MKRYGFTLAIASGIAVATMLGIAPGTANAQDTSNPEGCSVRSLEFGDTLYDHYDRGCDALDYIAIDDGFDTRAHFYHFEVDEATTVDINVESEWENVLILYDSEWNEISDSGEYYRQHSNIGRGLSAGIYYLQTFVDESLEPDGTYTEYGRYSLALREFNARQCLGNIPIGVATADTWSKGYCTSFIEGGEIAAHFLLEVDNHIALSVSLQADVATALSIYRRSDFGEVVGGTSRRLFGATEANLDNVELLPDDYILEVATNSPDAIGQDYELLLTRFSTSVRGEFDPVIGGIRVLHNDGGCTLGFPATLVIDDEEIHTLTTNAHCTSQRGRSDSTVLYSSIDDTPITQMGSITYSSDGSREVSLGELADPSFYGSATPESEFDTPLDKLRCVLQSDIDNRCSYSDAALFILDDAKLAAFRIARPSAPNTLTPKEFVATPFDYYADDATPSHLSIDLDNPYFTVIGVGIVAEDDVVHKVGATTGWTTGVVYSTCSHFGVAYDELGGDGQLLCQMSYESTEGAVLSGSGDSGSPVFKCVDDAGRDSDRDCSSGLVRLVGIHHSGSYFNQECFNDDEDDTCVADSGEFSSIHSVFREFNKVLDEDASVCWIVASDGDCVNTDEIDYSINCPVTSIPLENSLVDSWREVDCYPLVEDYYTAARYYRFSVESDTPIWVNATSLNDDYFSPRINILNGNLYRTYGQSLKKGDGRIEGFELEAGTYLLEISAQRRYWLEDFMLSVSAEGAERSPTSDTAVSPQPLDDTDPVPPPPDNNAEEPPAPIAPEEQLGPDLNIWNWLIIVTVVVGGLILAVKGIQILRK